MRLDRLFMRLSSVCLFAIAMISMSSCTSSPKIPDEDKAQVQQIENALNEREALIEKEMEETLEEIENILDDM